MKNNFIDMDTSQKNCMQRNFYVHTSLDSRNDVTLMSKTFSNVLKMARTILGLGHITSVSGTPLLLTFFLDTECANSKLNIVNLQRFV